MKERDAANWLNGHQKYDDGIALLRAIGVDDSEIRQIELSSDRFKILFYRIKKLLPKSSPHKETSNTRDISPKPTESVPVFANEKITLSAKREADILFKDMMNKRALLFQMCSIRPTPFENEAIQVSNREKLTTEIILLDKKVRQAYDVYRFVAEKGYAPKVSQQTRTGTPKLLLYQQIKNKRTYITKLKSKECLTTKQTVLLAKHEADLEQLLKEYQHELSEL